MILFLSAATTMFDILMSIEVNIDQLIEVRIPICIFDLICLQTTENYIVAIKSSITPYISVLLYLAFF